MLILLSCFLFVSNCSLPVLAEEASEEDSTNIESITIEDGETRLEIEDEVISDNNDQFSEIQETLSNEEYEYTISNNEVTITKYLGSETALIVPGTINDYPVISIGSYAFSGCTSLTELILPESVTKLGARMIQGTGISSITVPKGVTDAGHGNAYNSANGEYENFGPFDGVKELKEVIFEEGMKVIPAYICASAAIERVTLPDSVTSIGNYAFHYCESLEGVNLPANLTGIGYYAFSRCTSLAEISLPKTLKSIGSSAFVNCSSLSAVTFEEGETEGSALTEIGEYAFSGCTSLTELILPESV
ncbi:MAG: leucine-rich repeat protein, partial [Erysipelotrichaceae bacterium]|nr:leucine-rich repeat protein [Erysipelotrichaceae bacterium]